AEGAMQAAVNAVIGAAPGVWLYACYNAEYLFYPFCETRTVGEMLAFHAEERRDAMLAYVIDLYAADLTGPVALVLGAEGRGMRQLTARHCDARVHLPMLGQVESLNVSVAAGVCLYEAVRQRLSRRVNAPGV
ncbi:MAG: TrmH family RNA methyltransferase, partial [Ectothiorhodospira sp.]